MTEATLFDFDEIEDKKEIVFAFFMNTDSFKNCIQADGCCKWRIIKDSEVEYSTNNNCYNQKLKIKPDSKLQFKKGDKFEYIACLDAERDLPQKILIERGVN